MAPGAAAHDLSLYLVTDRRQTRGRSLEETVHAALEGGARAVQLREKDIPGARLLALATRLRKLTAHYEAALLVNDRVDVALAVDADGVHLGRESIGAQAARRLLGPDRLIGVSTHCVGEAVEARRAGADFVVFGPVYSTPAKAAYGPPKGPRALELVVASAGLPVLAIGGITVARVPEVRASGAAGIAVIAAIIAAEDPERRARKLRHALGSTLDRTGRSAVRKPGGQRIQPGRKMTRG